MHRLLPLILASLFAGMPAIAAGQDDFESVAEAAAVVLLPQIDTSRLDDATWIEYLRRIDEKTWNQKRKNQDFKSKLTATFKGIPVVGDFTASYAKFEEARRSFFSQTNYVEDKRKTHVVFRQYLTKAQIDAWLQAVIVGMGGSKGALRIYERTVTPSAATLEIVWIHPPGIPDPLPTFTATVVGGSVIGVDAGRLFPAEFKLSQGSHSVIVSRVKNVDLSVAINAAGNTATYSLPSVDSIVLSAASPIGTIVTSMLPPNRYGEVTGDSNGFLANVAKWVPADGRRVAGSKYADLIDSRVPDLRGMFLRGMNAFEPSSPRDDGKEDPEEDRRAGAYQADSLKSHKHPIPGFIGGRGQARQKGLSGGTSPATVAPRTNEKISQFTNDNSDGGKETRPRNIAVYYYIRIN